MSFLTNQIEAEDTIDPLLRETLVSGYFYDKTERGHNNDNDLLRRLIADIVAKRHDLMHHVFESYKRSRTWSYERLWRVFEAILCDFRLGKACILIDAIDECEDEARERLLRDFERLLEKRLERGKNVTFIFSSRQGSKLTHRKLHPYASDFSLDQDADLKMLITADMRRFVENKLRSDNYYRHEGETERTSRINRLTDLVVRRSEGSFLWASLVLTQLRGRVKVISSGMELERFLGHCPAGLHGLYFEVLVNILQEDRQLVIKVFHILLAAKRPLTIIEFKYAISIEKEHRTQRALQATIEEQEDFLRYIEDNLSSLVRVDNDGISLSHQSVRHFLLDSINDRCCEKDESAFSEARKAFRISVHDSEEAMAVSCMRLLTLDVFRKGKIKDDNEQLWAQSGFCDITDSGVASPIISERDSQQSDLSNSNLAVPLFEYAAEQWGAHYAATKDADIELEELAIVLCTQETPLVNWSVRYRASYWGFDDLPDELDPLIIGAYFGQSQLITSILRQANANYSIEKALAWAARRGHGEVVELLVQADASLNEPTLERRQPLLWAAAGGFLDIVNFFLEQDESLINAQDGTRCCALSLAMYGQHVEVVQRLLRSDIIDVNRLDSGGVPPISYSINEPGCTTKEMTILCLLLEDPRVHITIRNHRGRSCLSLFAEFGAVKAVKRILKTKSRKEEVEQLLADAGDEQGVSPLGHAIWWGHIDVVRLLCDTKRIEAQLNSVDQKNGANAFDRAAQQGKANIIRELCKYHPKGVNNRDVTGRTPLSTAMKQANIDVVQALCEGGADVNIPDYGGRTPISYGTGHFENIKYLVQEHHGEINQPDQDGHTPLWYAKFFKPDLDILDQWKALGAI